MAKWLVALLLVLAFIALASAAEPTSGTLEGTVRISTQVMNTHRTRAKHHSLHCSLFFSPNN